MRARSSHATSPADMSPERYAPTIAELAKSGSYKVVVATATTYGKDLIPRAAARIEAGVASDIAAVSVEGDSLVYKRPM